MLLPGKLDTANLTVGLLSMDQFGGVQINGTNYTLIDGLRLCREFLFFIPF